MNDSSGTSRSVPSMPRTLYATRVKRMLDVLVAATALVVSLPVIAVVALAVRVVLGSPVLFRDQRAGIKGRPIEVLKFRSMTNDTDEQGQTLPDAKRLGAFGKLLRRSSLDELPQLLNVVVGDMSLVGPRPLPMRYVSRYTPRQAGRLLVRPGLTGWAQIHGRNAVNWPMRLEYDARYVEMLGRPAAWLLDFRIIGATALQLVSQIYDGRGISARGVATMEEFAP